MNCQTKAVATLVNVCGESYSGTTMLELILGHGPRTFSCGEVAYWYRPISETHRQLRCNCGADPCLVWMPFRDVPPDRFHGDVARRLDVDLVTDSSKRLSWVIDANAWGTRGGLRVLNVAIWKSPLSHMYSHWKRGNSLTTAVRRYHRYYTRLLSWGAPVITVNYHRLTANPAAELETMCRRVGIAYFPGKECFWNHRSHSLFGNLRTGSQVGSTAGAIHDDAEYPPEFLAVADKLRPLWESPAMLMLGRALEAYDIGMPPTPANSPVNEFQTPWWYYRHRFSESWRAFLGRYRSTKTVE